MQFLKLTSRESPCVAATVRGPIQSLHTRRSVWVPVTATVGGHQLKAASRLPRVSKSIHAVCLTSVLCGGAGLPEAKEGGILLVAFSLRGRGYGHWTREYGMPGMFMVVRLCDYEREGHTKEEGRKKEWEGIQGNAKADLLPQSLIRKAHSIHIRGDRPNSERDQLQNSKTITRTQAPGIAATSYAQVQGGSCSRRRPAGRSSKRRPVDKHPRFNSKPAHVSGGRENPRGMKRGYLKEDIDVALTAISLEMEPETVTNTRLSDTGLEMPRIHRTAFGLASGKFWVQNRSHAILKFGLPSVSWYPAIRMLGRHTAWKQAEISSTKDVMEFTRMEHGIAMGASGVQAPCMLHASNVRKRALLWAKQTLNTCYDVSTSNLINWAPVHNVCSVVVAPLESRRATSCGYNSSHPVWSALYECLQEIRGDSSPFLLQPFHELSNGFWPHLTSPHPAIQFVPKMFYRAEVGALGGPVQSANIVVGVQLHTYHSQLCVCSAYHPPAWANAHNNLVRNSFSVRLNPHANYAEALRDATPTGLFGYNRFVDFVGPTVSERLACSPPTKANRVQSPVGPLTDFHMWESCRTMPLVGGLSRGYPLRGRGTTAHIPSCVHSRHLKQKIKEEKGWGEWRLSRWTACHGRRCKAG
ncbi:hypothetical protein PR048_016266 [Dryococelus australis]|uniref:Uncharacterized protein n=1 Tax=Dryococelus australis TaxID=614101 RepID=A0ABQ9HJN6_9NEOP|nr:hypothetical protein PR048_016266 [Dryococelus australis]